MPGHDLERVAAGLAADGEGQHSFGVGQPVDVAGTRIAGIEAAATGDQQPGRCIDQQLIKQAQQADWDCPGMVELTDVEIVWLDQLYGAAHEVAGWHYCELETGHAGRHAAWGSGMLAATGGCGGPRTVAAARSC